MKLINKWRVLGMVILTMLMTDSNAAMGSGGIIGMDFTYVTSYPTSYTSILSKESNAQRSDIHIPNKNVVEFAQLNWSNLTSDMAKGQGLYLSNIADLLEIPVAKRTAFYAMTKNKFTQLIPSPNTTPEQLVINLRIESAKL